MSVAGAQIGATASRGHGRTSCQRGSWVTRGHAAKRERRKVKNAQRRQRRRVRREGDNEKNQEARRKTNKKLEQRTARALPAQQNLFLAASVEIILHMSVEEAVIVFPC